MTRNKYRKKYLRWHSTYEKRATKLLRKTFKEWVSAIDFNDITELNYTNKINEALKVEKLEKTYIDIYKQIGKIHGQRVGKDINLNLKTFNLGTFLSLFESNYAYNILSNILRGRITTVRESFFEAIVDLFSRRLERDQDLREVTKEIQKIVKQPKFYKWQAERIARTESTAASNYAALQAGDVSMFKMQKEWISAHDNRTRGNDNSDLFDHVEMDGVRVGRYEKFKMVSAVGVGDDLDYPGDPTGEAGNVINCRCTVAVIPERDKEGNLILK